MAHAPRTSKSPDLGPADPGVALYDDPVAGPEAFADSGHKPWQSRSHASTAGQRSTAGTESSLFMSWAGMNSMRSFRSASSSWESLHESDELYSSSASASLSASAFSASSSSSGTTTRSHPGTHHHHRHHRRPRPASTPVPPLAAPTGPQYLEIATTRSRALVDEHVDWLQTPANHRREPVDVVQGIRIFEYEAVRFSELSREMQAHVPNERLRMKRYIARLEIPTSTVTEFSGLLWPEDYESDCYRDCYRLLTPEITDTLVLWRPEGDDLELRRRCTAVLWTIQRLPTVLTRDRDFITLEQHRHFECDGGARGYVHIRQSVEPPEFDPSLAHASRRLTRGYLHQSGIVAIETGTTLSLSIALEVDFLGSYTPARHRQAVCQQLGRWAALAELLWMTRMVRSGSLGYLDHKRTALNSAFAGRSWCEVCVIRRREPASKNVRRACQCCRRSVCSHCSRSYTFPEFLVKEARGQAHRDLAAQRMAEWKQGSVRATVCVLCVASSSVTRY